MNNIAKQKKVLFVLLSLLMVLTNTILIFQCKNVLNRNNNYVIHSNVLWK